MDPSSEIEITEGDTHTTFYIVKETVMTPKEIS